MGIECKVSSFFGQPRWWEGKEGIIRLICRPLGRSAWLLQSERCGYFERDSNILINHNSQWHPEHLVMIMVLGMFCTLCNYWSQWRTGGKVSVVWRRREMMMRLFQSGVNGDNVVRITEHLSTVMFFWVWGIIPITYSSTPTTNECKNRILFHLLDWLHFTVTRWNILVIYLCQIIFIAYK